MPRRKRITNTRYESISKARRCHRHRFFNLDQLKSLMDLYLIARLRVKYGHVAEAAEQLAKFVPILKPYGWTLLGAFHPVIGDFSEITDIWAIPSADAVTRVLEAASTGEIPGFSEVFLALREHVESETLSVCTTLPFSP